VAESVVICLGLPPATGMIQISKLPLRTEAKAIREEASRKTLELKQISEKYNTFLTESKDMVKVINERDKLKGENVKLSAEVNQLQEETKHLLLTGMLRWFLAGGGVFLAGLIAGKLSRKKKYY